MSTPEGSEEKKSEPQVGRMLRRVGKANTKNLKDEMKANATALDNRKMKQLLKEVMDKDAAPDMTTHVTCVIIYNLLNQAEVVETNISWDIIKITDEMIEKMKNFDADSITNGTSSAVVSLSKHPDFEGKVANAAILALRKWAKTVVTFCGGSDELIAACRRGKVEKVRQLLDSGISPNSVEPSTDRAALSFAVINGNLDIVNMLLEKGADINHKDKEQWTALHLAVCVDDNTPLDSTFVTPGRGILSALLDKKPDINATTDRLTTPLHLAYAYNFEWGVQKLLSSGADAEAKNIEGLLPIDAKERANWQEKAMKAGL